MKLFNTSTDTPIGDYPGTVPEALDAYARDVGWPSWAQWCAQPVRDPGSQLLRRGRAPVGELALVDGAGEAVYL